MNHSEIAHSWAHEDYGNRGGRNGSRMFTDEANRAVYSHGYHFMIARHTDVGGFRILHTYEDYGTSTTKRHISYVWSALSSPQKEHMFYCYSPQNTPSQIYHHEMLEHLPQLARTWVDACEAANKMKDRIDRRAAKRLDDSDQLEEWMDNRNGERDHALKEVQDRARELEAFRIAFEIKVKDIREPQALLRKKFLADKWQKLTEQQAAAARREAKRRDADHAAMVKRREEEQRETMEKWLAGEDVRITYYGGAARLRVKTTTVLIGGEQDRHTFVETSQGASVPVKDALLLWNLATRCRGRQQGWKRNGENLRLGSYHLDSVTKEGNAVIGCHRLNYEEMYRINEEVQLAVREEVTA